MADISPAVWQAVLNHLVGLEHFVSPIFEMPVRAAGEMLGDSFYWIAAFEPEQF